MCRVWLLHGVEKLNGGESVGTKIRIFANFSIIFILRFILIFGAYNCIIKAKAVAKSESVPF